MKRYINQQISHLLQLALLMGVVFFTNIWSVTAGEISGVVTDKTSGKPAKDAVVFVIHVAGQTFQPPMQMAIMDQINRQYMPHVLPVLVGTRMTFPNKDQVEHHLYSNSPARPFERPLYKRSNVKPVEFDKIGVVRLGCNIHPTMSGVILVLQNPYFAKTNRDGKYTIRDVPAGTYKIAVWYEFSRVRLTETVKVVEMGQTGQITVNHALAMTSPKRRTQQLGEYRDR